MYESFHKILPKNIIAHPRKLPMGVRAAPTITTSFSECFDVEVEIDRLIIPPRIAMAFLLLLQKSGSCFDS